MNPDSKELQPLTPPDILAIHATRSSNTKQLISYADDEAHSPRKNDTTIYSISAT
jgi:hypothetical protein